MRFALFKEVPKRQRRKKRKATNATAARKGDEDAEGSSEEESGDGDSGEETEEQRMSTPAPAQKNTTQDPIWGEEDTQDVNMDAEPQAAPAPTAAPAGPTTDGKIRQDRFVELLCEHMRSFSCCIL